MTRTSVSVFTLTTLERLESPSKEGRLAGRGLMLLSSSLSLLSRPAAATAAAAAFSCCRFAVMGPTESSVM